MNPCEWSLFLNALAISIAKGKTQDELAFLSLLFSQLSTSFALLSSTPPGCQPPSSPVADAETTSTSTATDEAILST